MAEKKFTVAQYRSVLEHIATRAGVLHQLLLLMQRGFEGGDMDRYNVSVVLDAAEALACTIGAVADDASGGGVRGTAEEWHCGASFAERGKAGAA
ncbi:MAG: hypothetical protein QM586_06800 [Xenophilus sp.]